MKIVITGPSSSGKSEIIEELKSRGYKTIDESARIILNKYINEEHSKQLMEKKQREMIELQIYNEDRINYYEKIFLDRGIIDYIVYSKEFKLNNPINNIFLNKRYDAVFSLDPIKFYKDNIRIEKNMQETIKIYDKIERMYKYYNHRIITVPIFSENKKENIKKRAEYIIVNAL
jgi:predicted ATPase